MSKSQTGRYGLRRLVAPESYDDLAFRHEQLAPKHTGTTTTINPLPDEELHITILSRNGYQRKFGPPQDWIYPMPDGADKPLELTVTGVEIIGRPSARRLGALRVAASANYYVKRGTYVL